MAELMATTLFTVGGVSVSVGTTLAVATAAYSMSQSAKAADQQQAAMEAAEEGVKEQQYIEKLKSKEESNIRRERLLTALAAQTAGAGAAGVRGSTVEALQLKSMEDYRRDQLQSDAIGASIQKGFERQRESLKFQAESAKYQGIADMAMTLAQTGFSMGSPTSPTKTPMGDVGITANPEALKLTSQSVAKSYIPQGIRAPSPSLFMRSPQIPFKL